jgi:nucleotide-binding universal stress UspA family protein
MGCPDPPERTTMSIKRILVPLTGEGSGNHVALCALKLAQRFSAHVSAVDAVAETEFYIDPVGAGMTVDYYSEIQKVLEQAKARKQKAARAAFDAAIAASQVPLVEGPSGQKASASWTSAPNGDAPRTTLGELADLVVVDRPDDNVGATGMKIAVEAIFAAHRPVLVLPHGVAELGKHAAIAWNGSHEAANAVRSAIAFIDPANPVTIIQVGDIREDRTPMEELVSYLGWHGLQANVQRVPDQPKATGRLIMNAARAAGADFLVMGAYTHSRLREALIGGVTAYMLQHADMPILMGR